MNNGLMVVGLKGEEGRMVGIGKWGRGGEEIRIGSSPGLFGKSQAQEGIGAARRGF